MNTEGEKEAKLMQTDTLSPDLITKSPKKIVPTTVHTEIAGIAIAVTTFSFTLTPVISQNTENKSESSSSHASQKS